MGKTQTVFGRRLDGMDLKPRQFKFGSAVQCIPFISMTGVWNRKVPWGRVILMLFAARGQSSTADLMSFSTISQFLTRFKEYLRGLRVRHDYPGTGPSARYVLASNQEAYLYALIGYEDSLVQLLRFMKFMVHFGTSLWRVVILTTSPAREK